MYNQDAAFGATCILTHVPYYLRTHFLYFYLEHMHLYMKLHIGPVHELSSNEYEPAFENGGSGDSGQWLSI